MRKERGEGPVSWSTAVKFLCARKFEVVRAVALYDQHEATRHREGLLNFDPTVEPLKSELDTAKFTILVKNHTLLPLSKGYRILHIRVRILAHERCHRSSYRRIYSSYPFASNIYSSDYVTSENIDYLLLSKMQSGTF